MLVRLAAGTPADRDDLGHAVGVIDVRDAERPGGRPRQARGQHLTTHHEAAQPEVVGAHAGAPGRRHKLGEIAGDGQQDRGAPLGQAVQRCLRRHDAERTTPGSGQAAAGGRQLHGQGAPRAQIHLHDIAGPQLASQHRGQRAERGPQLHLIARQPHLRGSPGGAGGAGGQVSRDVGAAEISWPFHQVRLDRDRDRPQPRDVDLGRVCVRRGEAARVKR